MSEDYDIQIIARPKWEKFQNIDLNYFHNLNVLLIKDEYVNYSRKDVIEFVKQYREYYNIEPSKYAMYAYDITLNFTNFFYSNENIKCLENLDFKGIIFKYNLQKTKQGWSNNDVFVIHYDSEYNQKVFNTIHKEAPQKSLLE